MAVVAAVAAPAGAVVELVALEEMVAEVAPASGFFLRSRVRLLEC